MSGWQTHHATTTSVRIAIWSSVMMRRSPMMDFSLIRASALWPQKKQMTQFVPIPIAFILLTLFRVFANVDVTEYRMLKQTEDYNELIPPSNPKFPWKPDWEPLCYYCAQPIRLTKPWAGHRQRVVFHWEHLDGHYTCDIAKLRPTEEIDDPRCHICRTQTHQHDMVCSAGGKPTPCATTMSDKEHELTKIFGWGKRIDLEP